MIQNFFFHDFLFLKLRMAHVIGFWKYLVAKPGEVIVNVLNIYSNTYTHHTYDETCENPKNND